MLLDFNIFGLPLGYVVLLFLSHFRNASNQFLGLDFVPLTVAANGRSFEELGKRIGISEKRVTEILTQFTTQHTLTEQLIEASFLLPDTKKTYLAEYRQRRNRLKDMK